MKKKNILIVYVYNNDNLDETIKKYGGFYIARYEAGVPENLQSIDNNISAEIIM